MKLLNKLSRVKDTLDSGFSILNGNIHNIQLYATNRCNSKCNICYIWNEQPKYDLPVEIIQQLLDSKKIDSNAIWDLVGGEFILHPDCEEIISLFNQKKKRYALRSNGIDSEKLIGIVERFKVPALFLSLDGTKETYKKVRGVDAYDNVIKVIETLNNVNSKTKIGITFVINPFNTVEDFIHVKQIVDMYELDLGVIVYDNRPLHHTRVKSENLFDISEVFKSSYLESYKLWYEGNLNIPCFSLRTILTVMSNGDVPICQQKYDGRNSVLGNLHKNTVDDIWNSDITKAVFKIEEDCHDCWIPCYKGLDNHLNRLVGWLR